MLIGGTLWLHIRAKRAMAAGEGYGEHPHEGLDTKGDLEHSPPFLIALLPILLVIGFNALFTYVVFPNTSFDAQPIPNSAR